MAVFGKCKLCKRYVKLVDGHIIPNSFYKPLRGGPGKNQNPVVMRNGMSTSQKSFQVSEHLLCKVCDNNNLGVTDGFAKEKIVGNGMGFPVILENVAAVKDRGCVGKITDVVYLDKLLRFAYSVFWRASVSSADTLSFKLPDLLEEEIRLYLLDAHSKPPTSTSLVVSVLDLPGYLSYPGKKRDYSYQVLILPGPDPIFVSLGIQFCIYTELAQSAIKNIAVKESGLVLLGQPDLCTPTLREMYSSQPVGSKLEDSLLARKKEF